MNNDVLTELRERSTHLIIITIILKGGVTEGERRSSFKLYLYVAKVALIKKNTSK